MSRTSLTRALALSLTLILAAAGVAPAQTAPAAAGAYLPTSYPSAWGALRGGGRVPGGGGPAGSLTGLPFGARQPPDRPSPSCLGWSSEGQGVVVALVKRPLPGSNRG